MFEKNTINAFGSNKSKTVYITRIIISVPVFMLSAFLYLAFTPAKYVVSARIAVDRQQQPADIINDIKSRKLVSTAINKLQLTISYYKPVIFKKREIYGDSLPIKFVLLSGVKSPAEISVKILSDDKCEINQDDTLQEIAFNKPETYSFGRFTVVKGPAFKVNGNPVIIKFNSEASLLKDYEHNLGASAVKNKNGYIDLSIKTNSIAKGKDFLKVLGSALALTENKPVLVAATNNNTDKLNLIHGQLQALEMKAGGLRKRQALITNNKKEKITPVKKTNLQKSLQEQVLEVIKPYAEATIAQFVQIPYGKEISDKNLVSLVNDFNQLQVEKQRAFINASNPNKVIPAYNAQLGKLKVNMLQRINEDLQQMQQINVLPDLSMSAIDNVQDSINKNDKLIKLKQLEYRKYLLKKTANLNSQNSQIFKPDVITPDQSIAIYPKKAYIFIIALFSGLILPVIFSYILFYIRLRFFQKV